MVWDNKRLHPRLAALRIILFIFIQHYRHGVMCQRENVGRPYVLVTSGEGRSTLSVCHIHGLSFTPPYGLGTDGLPWLVYTASLGRRFMFSLYKLSNFSPNAAASCSLNMA